MKVIDSFQKAIRTEYKGPTNTQGSRIVAKCGTEGKKVSISVSYDHSIDMDKNHHLAARKLVEKLNWNCTEMVCGWYDGCGFFVFSK